MQADRRQQGPRLRALETIEERALGGHSALESPDAPAAVA
jgi:hypothetical protein